MEEEITAAILLNFTENTGIKVKIAKAGKQERADGTITFTAGREKETVPFEAKSVITNSHLPALIDQFKKNGKLLVLAGNIPQHIKIQLREIGINYIDRAGNANIRAGNLFIYLDGLKDDKQDSDNKAKAFSKAGLKVIFQFLEYPELINTTIRNIADRAAVSLDTVHKTIQGLKQAGYLLQANQKKLQWTNRKELLQKWTEEYDTKLKPALHTANFRFVNDREFDNWKKLTADDKEMKWSGEPGGELYTGFLKPETLTLYTTETKGMLVKKYRMVPDQQGYIKVYKPFWNNGSEKENAAPAILVYADLVNTGNKRNIETAQKIYGKYIQDKL